MSLAGTLQAKTEEAFCTSAVGDGVSTTITVTTQDEFKRSSETISATATDTPTGVSSTQSGATGMLEPTGGTPLTVNSATMASGVVTITLSAAPTNGHTIKGRILFSASSARL